MSTIIVDTTGVIQPQDLDTEAEEALTKIQLKNALLIYRQMLKAIEIAETFVVPLNLSYKKSLINYYCGDINYYQFNYYQAIRGGFIWSFIDRGL